jgi:hypothetical protein
MNVDGWSWLVFGPDEIPFLTGRLESSKLRILLTEIPPPLPFETIDF